MSPGVMTPGEVAIQACGNPGPSLLNRFLSNRHPDKASKAISAMPQMKQIDLEA